MESFHVCLKVWTEVFWQIVLIQFNMLLSQVAYLASLLLFVIPVAKVSRMQHVSMSSLIQLTNLCNRPRSQANNKRTCLQVLRQGSIKESGSSGTCGLRSSTLSSAYVEEEEHWWCQSCVYHKLAHHPHLLFDGFWWGFGGFWWVFDGFEPFLQASCTGQCQRQDIGWEGSRTVKLDQIQPE